MADLPNGMTISEDEYNLISKALVAMAEQARAHGETDAYAVIKRFVVRMKQHVFAGEGVNPDTLQRLMASIETAFSRGDYEGARVGIVGLLAAVVRMDPDPAHQIALQLAPTFVQLTRASAGKNQSKIGATVLRRFNERLKADRAAFERDGWSDPAATLDYIRDLAEFSAGEFDNGVDPFAATDDAEDPASH